MTTTFTNINRSQTAYNGATQYTPGQVVVYLYNLYTCILTTTGNLPTNITYWAATYTNQSKS